MRASGLIGLHGCSGHNVDPLLLQFSNNDATLRLNGSDIPPTRRMRLSARGIIPSVEVTFTTAQSSAFPVAQEKQHGRCLLCINISRTAQVVPECAL
jgi:hypothetical protein